MHGTCEGFSYPHQLALGIPILVYAVPVYDLQTVLSVVTMA
jgi:hypothetical protein